MESVSQSILKLLIFLDTVQWLSKAQADDLVKTLRKVGLKTSTPDLGSSTVSESSGVGKWKRVSYAVNTTQCVQKSISNWNLKCSCALLKISNWMWWRTPKHRMHYAYLAIFGIIERAKYGVSLKRSCKMQFRRIDLVSIGLLSQKLWPTFIFGWFPHCSNNVKLNSAGGFLFMGL